MSTETRSHFEAISCYCKISRWASTTPEYLLLYLADRLKLATQEIVILHRSLVETVHVQSIQWLHQLVNDTHSMVTMRLVNTLSAELPIQKAWVLETDVLNVLISMGLSVNTEPLIIRIALVHNASLVYKDYSRE